LATFVGRGAGAILHPQLVQNFDFWGAGTTIL
jgi:hypothetical protein